MFFIVYTQNLWGFSRELLKRLFTFTWHFSSQLDVIGVVYKKIDLTWLFFSVNIWYLLQFELNLISICFCYRCNIDIEAQIADIQTKKKELAASQASEKGVGLLESGYFDSELYDDGADKKKRFEGYNTSIAANDDVDDDDDEGLPITKRTTYTAPKSILKDVIKQVRTDMLIDML